MVSRKEAKAQIINSNKMTFKPTTHIKFFVLLAVIFSSYNSFAKPPKNKGKPLPKTTKSYEKRDSVYRKVVPFDIVMTKKSKETKNSNSSSSEVDDIIWFAKKQLGTPYKYASADPKNGGLDCSGFLFYVFTHFNIKVPRSSKDYMNYGKTIDVDDAKKGDVVVFTGTNASQRIGGHVGLVLENNGGNLKFIHGSSGKASGVTISNLSEGYYSKRFLKVVRVVN